MVRLSPLVEPGPELSASDRERFARHLPIPELGELAQRRLRAAKVCVVGAGGLGCPALLYLAAAGVGTLGVVDADTVELVNLQRQVLHSTGGIGTAKTTSAADRLAELDPGVRVVEHRLRLDAGNAGDVLGGYDLVLDAVDNYPTRYLISDTCAELGIPVVWGAVRVTRAQVSVFWDSPRTTDRPVPGLTLRDLHPEPPDPATWVTAAGVGVLGAMCGQVGALMATEAIKLITGAGDSLFGRLLYLDTMAATTAAVPLAPQEDPVSEFTHLAASGQARMVDVSGKAVTVRSATAEGFVHCPAAVVTALRAGDVPKGDVLAVARIAGIAAAKRTPELLPLAHVIGVHGVSVEVSVTDDGVAIEATVRTADRTGVEMEALTAVSVAALAVVDMVKGLDKRVEIAHVRLVAKSGGRSGDWRRDSAR